VKLPEPINSDGHDYGACPDTGTATTMFFSSGTDSPFAPVPSTTLYVSERQNDRAPLGSAHLPSDTLNCPTCFGGLPTIRAGARRSAGWAIAETALAIRIFTVRYGDEHRLPLTMRLRAESDLLLFLRFESFGSASQTLRITREVCLAEAT
jgi:hypothetical protein